MSNKDVALGEMQLKKLARETEDRNYDSKSVEMFYQQAFEIFGPQFLELKPDNHSYSEYFQHLKGRVNNVANKNENLTEMREFVYKIANLYMETVIAYER